MCAEELAVWIAKHYQTNDPFMIAETRGIIVFYAPLPDMSSYYVQCLGKKIIVLNSKLNTKEAKIMCAHLLGCAIMYPYMMFYAPTPDLAYVSGEAFAEELLDCSVAINPKSTIGKEKEIYTRQRILEAMQSADEKVIAEMWQYYSTKCSNSKKQSALV